MSVKITPKKESDTIVVKTKQSNKSATPSDWWNANSKKEMSEKLLGTVSFLKLNSQQRYRQASIFARLYGNIPLMGAVGSTLSKMSGLNNLPSDRPTMSVITSCIDTVVARISQDRPRPVFLTDNGDYKKRSLAKQLNHFLEGEYNHCKAYELGPIALRDSAIFGTGILKVLKDQNNRVSIERRLEPDLMVDPNDSFYGSPRQMYENKLVDRAVALEMFSQYKSMIEKAEQAYPDSSGDANKSVSDMIMLCEGWHLPSGPDSDDGMHSIATSEGLVFEEPWKRDRFPFAFMHYSKRLVGFWGQGIAERQMGTQMAINQYLMTAHRSLQLAGVPRVFVEEGSKVVKSHINNDIGAIVTFRGTMPVIAPPAQVLPQEMYMQIQNLIQYAYKQEGVSEMAASSQKPLGLNSGKAIREYDDIQSDRFAWVQKQYSHFLAVDLAHLIIDEAVGIAEKEGSYKTVYPNKDGIKEISIPEIKTLKEEPYVIQEFKSSSLPRDPAGRLQTVTELMQAGIISPQEGRRLLDYPDIDQVERLANASEERILKILDQIVEEGKYTPPDPFMDLDKANELAVQYYNLYSAAKLEPERAEMLRQFFLQVQATKLNAAQAMSPVQPPSASPQAIPEARPVSDVLPNVPQG